MAKKILMNVFWNSNMSFQQNNPLAAAEELPTADTNIQHCCTKWHEVFFALTHACPRGQGTSVTKGPPGFSSLVVLWFCGWCGWLARPVGRHQSCVAGCDSWCPAKS